MKSKQQNNPVVLGVMGIAFLFILARIFKTLTGGGDPLPPAKTDGEAIHPAVAQTGKIRTTPQPAAMSGRDPFNHPYLVQVAQEEADKQKNRDGSIGTTQPKTVSNPHGRRTTRMGLLPNVMPPTYNSQQVLGGFAGDREQRTGDRIQLPNNPTTQRPNDTMPQRPNAAEKWRVTAILGGSHPTAVVESAEMSPRTVAVGDELQGFRIAAIRSDEIVVASATTVLTLPLETRNETNDEKTEKTDMNSTKALTAANTPKP